MDGERIRIFSFVAICGVVAQHSALNLQIAQWIVPAFTYWPVPLFFIISGYFFSLSIRRHPVKELVRKKLKSLFIPYCLWCVIGWCLFMPVLPANFFDVAKVVFAIGESICPRGNAALWYVRALMLFMAIGLIFWPLMRVIKNRVIAVAIYAVILCGARIVLQRHGVGMSPGSSPIFFLIGFGLAEFKFDEVECRRGKMLSVVVLIISFALSCLGRWYVFGSAYDSANHFLQNLINLSDIVWIWLALDYVSFPAWLTPAIAVTPFVYFFHYPAIFGVDKILAHYRVFGFQGGALTVYYLVRCLIFPVVFVLIALAFKRFLPRTYNVLSGGR